MVHSYLRIGEIYYRNNELKKALSNVLNSQKISIKYQYLEYQKEAYELLSKIYYESKKYKKAYKTQLHYKKLSDSILNKNKIRKIAQLEYEYEYRERLSSAEKRETSLKEKVITIDEKLKIYHQQKLWGIIGFLSLVIILSIIIFLLRIKV